MSTPLPPTPDLWNLLHDGYVDDLERPAPDVLRLRVRCMYLAERLNPRSDAFRIELHGVTLATYEPYDRPAAPLAQVDTHGRIDFVTAEVEGDHLAIWGSAGCLRLAYASAVLALDDGRKITLEALRAEAAAYWETFGKHGRRASTAPR